jgi:hypothetical protein
LRERIAGQFPDISNAERIVRALADFCATFDEAVAEGASFTLRGGKTPVIGRYFGTWTAGDVLP